MKFLYEIDIFDTDTHNKEIGDETDRCTRQKVLFKDLLLLPKREQPTAQRKKTFECHLLTSDENQSIIRKLDQDARKKEK